MRALRIGLGALGLVIGVFGLWLLLSRQDLDQLTNAAVWLVAGVVLHDGVLALVTLVLGALLLPLLPRAARGPAVVGFVVLGSATLFAVPVLGRFGARPDNPTLLDRPYTLGWLALAAIVLLGVVLASVLRSRTGSMGEGSTGEGGVDGADPGGRRRPHGA